MTNSLLEHHSLTCVKADGETHTIMTLQKSVWCIPILLSVIICLDDWGRECPQCLQLQWTENVPAGSDGFSDFEWELVIKKLNNTVRLIVEILQSPVPEAHALLWQRPYWVSRDSVLRFRKSSTELSIIIIFLRFFSGKSGYTSTTAAVSASEAHSDTNLRTRLLAQQTSREVSLGWFRPQKPTFILYYNHLK